MLAGVFMLQVLARLTSMTIRCREHAPRSRVQFRAGCFIFFVCYGRTIMARHFCTAGFTDATALAVPARRVVSPGTLVFLRRAR
jgi:hypothetical protein